MWLFLLLVAVPIIEIALFIQVGGLIGLWPTIAIVVLTAIAGTVLLRAQGFATLAQLRSRLDRGGDPTGPLANGALILVAGIVLLTPGFFTDAIGFLLLVPPVRAAVIRYLSRRITVVAMRTAGSGAAGHRAERPARGATVDGSYEEVDPTPGADRQAGGRIEPTRTP